MHTSNQKTQLNPHFDKDAFDRLLQLVETANKTPKFQDLADDYNIREYNIDTLTTNEVRTYYNDIISKYLHKQIKRNWCENQLKIFVWMVFHYAEVISVRPEAFNKEHWTFISSTFVNKDYQDCKFQLLSISKSPNSNNKWTQEENQMLYEIAQQPVVYSEKWISRLYKQSQTKFFRRPKECRERWRNYLDPHLQKGDWTLDDDKRLLELILEIGSKWSSIAKQLQTRTEHAVKNRYRSLIKKYTKLPPSKQKNRRPEKNVEVIKRIIKEIESFECKTEIDVPVDTTTNQNIKQLSIRDYQEAREREKEREDFEKFCPISPNSAFRLCENRRTDLYSHMIIVASPRIMTPVNYKNIDWGDSNRDAYFL